MTVQELNLLSGHYQVYGADAARDEMSTIVAGYGQEMMNDPDQEPVDINAVIASMLPTGDQKYFSGVYTSCIGPNLPHIRGPGEPCRGLFDTSITFIEPNDPAWNGRRNLLTALVNSAVRSASLVPESREHNQTLYVRNLSYPRTQDPMWALMDDEEFERRHDQSPNSSSKPIMDMIEGEIPGIDPNAPVERRALEGFVQPYDGIELNAIHPESPFDGRRINVLTESTNDLVDQAAREKFTEISNLFKADAQTRELALTLVDGEETKRFYLIKTAG